MNSANDIETEPAHIDSQTVKSIARECGFELAGIASAVPSADLGRFGAWADAGMAGRMSYLTDHRSRVRQDPRNL